MLQNAVTYHSQKAVLAWKSGMMGNDGFDTSWF